MLVRAARERCRRRSAAALHRALVRRVAREVDVDHAVAEDVVLDAAQQTDWPKYAPRYHWFEGLDMIRKASLVGLLLCFDAGSVLGRKQLQPPRFGTN